MTAPSALVHRYCGSPRMASCEDAVGRCWLCAGQHTRGEPVARTSSDPYPAARFGARREWRPRRPQGEES